MNPYVYIQSEKGGAWIDGLGRHQTCVDLYTVGFYRPDGKFEPESDHTDKEKAAARVAHLNGERKP